MMAISQLVAKLLDSVHYSPLHCSARSRPPPIDEKRGQGGMALN